MRGGPVSYDSITVNCCICVRRWWGERGRRGRRGEEGRKDEDEKVNTVSSLVMESYTCTGDFPEILRAKLEPLLFIYLCLWTILSFWEVDKLK